MMVVVVPSLAGQIFFFGKSQILSAKEFTEKGF
jgi:hypothetical protein